MDCSIARGIYAGISELLVGGARRDPDGGRSFAGGGPDTGPTADRHAKRFGLLEYERAPHWGRRRMASRVRFRSSRKAILLVAGKKAGANRTKFCRDLIRIADRHFHSHLS